MNCDSKGVCKYAYRKAGRNTLHCEKQKSGQWDFCAHQYLCQRSGHYELSREANDCSRASSIHKTIKAEKATPAKKAKQATAKKAVKNNAED